MGEYTPVNRGSSDYRKASAARRPLWLYECFEGFASWNLRSQDANEFEAAVGRKSPFLSREKAGIGISFPEFLA